VDFRDVAFSVKTVIAIQSHAFSVETEISIQSPYRLFYRALLQKRPIILRSLLIEATP